MGPRNREAEDFSAKSSKLCLQQEICAQMFVWSVCACVFVCLFCSAAFKTAESGDSAVAGESLCHWERTGSRSSMRQVAVKVIWQVSIKANSWRVSLRSENLIPPRNTTDVCVTMTTDGGTLEERVRRKWRRRHRGINSWTQTLLHLPKGTTFTFSTFYKQ